MLGPFGSILTLVGSMLGPFGSILGAFWTLLAEFCKKNKFAGPTAQRRVRAKVRSIVSQCALCRIKQLPPYPLVGFGEKHLLADDGHASCDFAPGDHAFDPEVRLTLTFRWSA